MKWSSSTEKTVELKKVKNTKHEKNNAKIGQEK